MMCIVTARYRGRSLDLASNIIRSKRLLREMLCNVQAPASTPNSPDASCSDQQRAGGEVIEPRGLVELTGEIGRRASGRSSLLCRGLARDHRSGVLPWPLSPVERRPNPGQIRPARNQVSHFPNQGLAMITVDWILLPGCLASDSDQPVPSCFSAPQPFQSIPTGKIGHGRASWCRLISLLASQVRYLDFRGHRIDVGNPMQTANFQSITKVINSEMHLDMIASQPWNDMFVPCSLPT